MFSLASFSLSDMSACAAEIRKLGAGAASTQDIAEQITQYFYRQLGDDRTGKQDCSLVRYFTTRSYRELDSESQDCACQVLGRTPHSPDMKCLTLVATAGERPEWNHRARSRRYRAIPLTSERFVARFPMFSQLLTQLGVTLESRFESDSDLLIDWTEQTYNGFCVPEAKGSPFVPAQDDFVIPYGIQSVVGFGGLLPWKELFVLILFSKVKVSYETAKLFKPLALSAKLAMLPFDGAATTHHAGSTHSIDRQAGKVEQLQSQVDALEQLLAVHERTVIHDTEQRTRVEEALRESQEQYRLLVTTANDIIYRTDVMGHFTFLNPVAMRILKYTEDQLLGRRFVELIRPDHREEAERFYGLQFVRRRPSTYYEFPALAQDGTEVWIGQNVQILQEDGKVVGFQAVARDITGRKQAEKALLDSEEYLRSIIQSTGDAIILMDSQGEVVFWNTGAEKNFGYAAAEMVGRPVSRIVPERFREAHERGVQRVAAAGRLTVPAGMFELVGLRKDGTEFPLEFSLAAWTAKSGLLITGIMRDISERKRAEEALRAGEERLQLVLDTLPAGAYTCDAEGLITYFNARAVEVWGREPKLRHPDDRFCGSFKLFRPDGVEVPHDRCWMAMALKEQQTIISNEIVIERPNGSRRSVLAHASPLKDLSGRPVGAVNVLVDITERKQAELALLESRRALELSQEELRALTARIESVQEEERIRIAREVHDELGQALTGVKLQLASLRDQLSEQPPVARDRVDSISKLVDGTMQSVQKIATDLRPVVLDQLGLIPAVEWQAREFQTTTGIQCTLNIYLRTVDLSVNRSTGVFRIFQEVLTNIARHAQATSVNICMQEHAGHLLLDVSDNGRGITDAELSGSRSLGLLGMRERALLLGGEARIERKQEKGTVVKIRIPLNRSEPE